MANTHQYEGHDAYLQSPDKGQRHFCSRGPIAVIVSLLERLSEPRFGIFIAAKPTSLQHVLKDMLE